MWKMCTNTNITKNIEIIGLLAKCNQHNFLMIYGIFCWKEHTSPKILLVYLFTVSVTKGKIAKAGPAWGSRRVKMWLQVMVDVSTKFHKIQKLNLKIYI